MNVPKLRFKGFEGAWEEYAMSEVGTFKKGSNLSKSDLSEEGKPCVLYGELYTTYGPVINEIKSRTNKLINKSVYGEKNDVLIPASGESAEDIATASSLNENEVLLGGDINIFTPKKDNGNFISYQINSSRKNQLVRWAQGASVVHIYKDSLSKLKLRLPSLEEQIKIANFFEKLDLQIELQTKKIDELKEQKKGLLQTIFSRELRFTDENEELFPEWKRYRLDEIVERVTRKNKGVVTSLPLTISAQHGLVDQVTFFNNTVASTNLEGYFLLKKGEFAYNKSYSAGYPLGAIKRLNNYEQGALSTLYICFKPKAKVYSDFLEQYFETTLWHKEVSMISVEGARNHGLLNVAVGDFFSTIHSIPSYDEQVKIADFLSKFDTKIKHENDKLSALQEQKKGLLQQMFV
ncbi:type I restriction enzyme, S subunit [Bhargavaea beijingensis]|uniref:Type I restriction enzyme, S subunit n=1 Tax=Bhargavaea beijingensis TaxID=426756 RepID=A0A1G7GQ84_9BACL|nr:restriction endonuclease subunit S [Bhargavaea beijingensis]SDE90325.1 type I restriction enzyme, S subunit [Bhargavaea beijingensis]